jgi:hypothetical protein
MAQDERGRGRTVRRGGRVGGWIGGWVGGWVDWVHGGERASPYASTQFPPGVARLAGTFGDSGLPAYPYICAPPENCRAFSTCASSSGTACTCTPLPDPPTCCALSPQNISPASTPVDDSDDALCSIRVWRWHAWLCTGSLCGRKDACARSLGDFCEMLESREPDHDGLVMPNPAASGLSSAGLQGS